MTLCNAEVIKKIKDLEERKQEVLLNERQNLTTTYQTEADKIDTGYCFDETRKSVEGINKEIMKLKHALNVANAIPCYVTHITPFSNLAKRRRDFSTFDEYMDNIVLDDYTFQYLLQ